VSTDLATWLAAVRSGVAAASVDAGPFGQHVSVLTTTGSTNDDVARAASDGAPEGYTVIAAEQTAGRGRRGAAWHSPAAHGLYLSTLLRPDRWSAVRADPASPASTLVTLMAGVAVVSAIGDACGSSSAELKWPNDVMVRRTLAAGGRNRESGVGSRESASTRGPAWRKLGGILAEGASDGGTLRTVVLGIGVNLHRCDAPDDVAARMITIDDLMSAENAASETLASLVGAALRHLRRGVELLASGAADDVRRRWRRLAPSVEGTPVRWHAHGQTRRGYAAGIDDTGALRVRLGDGAHVTVHGGEIEWFLEDREA
jgi:BirA family biotin operon repressor/biotin-[acetyl-CoA-carboxylase] ligase